MRFDAEHSSSQLGLVSSFHTIVVFLIENSLFTSHASRIIITVNFNELWIEVIDNGESCHTND